MAQVVIPKTAQILQMTDLKAGELTGATLHLSSTDILPDVETVKADLTECLFGGYAASGAITWGAINENEDGLAQIVGQAITFQCSGVAPDETAYIAYILSAGVGTPLLLVWRLDNPKLFEAATDALTIVPVFTYGSQSG